MRKLSKAVLVFLFFSQIIAFSTHAQSWQWVVQDDGFCYPYGFCFGGSVGSVVTDRNGNVYFGGETGEIRFGSFYAGETHSASHGQPGVAYFAKVDSMGNMIWIKGLGPSNPGSYRYKMDFSSLIVDHLGNVYSLTYDESIDSADLYKLNPSGGWVWLRHPPFGYSYLGDADFLSIDNADNLYLAGASHFVSGGLVVGSVTVSTTYPYNNLITSYDTAGNAIWARVFGDTMPLPYINGSTLVTATTTDNYGKMIIAGNSSADSVCFGSVTLYQPGYTGTNYLFYAKYDSTGNLLWAKTAYGNLPSNGNSLLLGLYSIPYYAITGLSTDVAGNFYMVGDAGDSITFGTTKTYKVRSFLAKFNSSGNLMWLMHNPDSSYGSITNDAAGNIYVSDLFYNYYLSGADSIGFSRTPSYFGSALSILKFDTSGNLIWSHQGPDAQVSAMSCSITGSLYLGGNYNLSSITFGDTTLINGAPGSPRVFLTKLDTQYTDATHNIVKLQDNFILYPNPTTGNLTLIPDKQGYTQISIYDVLGRVMYSLPLTGLETRVNVDMNNIPDGSYYLKATGAGATETLPFVVRR